MVFGFFVQPIEIGVDGNWRHAFHFSRIGVLAGCDGTVCASGSVFEVAFFQRLSFWIYRSRHSYTYIVAYYCRARHRDGREHERRVDLKATDAAETDADVDLSPRTNCESARVIEISFVKVGYERRGRAEDLILPNAGACGPGLKDVTF